MGKRGAGAIFCLVGAIMFSARYIAAAIFMSGISSWGGPLFNSGLEYVGAPLLTLSIISFIIGSGYLIWAEISERKK